MKWWTFLTVCMAFCPLLSRGQGNPSALPNGCTTLKWATWGAFTGNSAVGKISSQGKVSSVTMKSSVEFIAFPEIFNYASAFGKFPNRMPNKTVPKTTWSAPGPKPEATTMCFSQPVKNPVMMVASLGGDGVASLKFSVPFIVVYQSGDIRFTGGTTMAGNEGNTVIMFPGEFTCVSIISSSTEKTYITWGLAECPEPTPPPEPKPVPPPPVPKPAPKPPVKAVIPKPEPVTIPKPKVIPPAVQAAPASKTGTRITIWDFDCIDFDSVSITLNGKQIGPKAIELPGFKQYFNLPEFTYGLDLQQGDNTLEIYAINEGTNPFNSIGMFIVDDQSRKQLYYKLKTKEKAVIHLVK